jgi:light-regulated signal transduction histidine kinase (bacteriophytochrome)
MDSKENVLGTFVLYYTQPRKSTEEEIELIKSYANIAALAIQSHHVKSDLKIYAEELKRSNNDLNDFAYIASHDLQEPLRKISIFSERLLEDKAFFNEKHMGYLSRM